MMLLLAKLLAEPGLQIAVARADDNGFYTYAPFGRPERVRVDVFEVASWGLTFEGTTLSFSFGHGHGGFVPLDKNGDEIKAGIVNENRALNLLGIVRGWSGSDEQLAAFRIKKWEPSGAAT